MSEFDRYRRLSARAEASSATEDAKRVDSRDARAHGRPRASMGAFCRWARFDFSIFGDAPERASTADMTVDAGEAAAHARAVVTVFHFIAYSLAGLAFGFAVFVNVYVMIALDDLQSDFVNPHDATRRINRLIAWEIGAHACGCAFMLVGGHWVMVLANAPLVYYHYVGCARLWNSFFIHSFRSLSP